MSLNINLTFLGTSAQIPTAKRNHSGIFLNYDSENILIDCGEGMQRQFRIAKLNPCKINRILITHIYGPKGIKNFMKKFFDLFHINMKIKIEVKEVSGKFLEGDKFYLEAEKMEHGIPTNAYNFIIKDKIRIDKKKLEKLKLPLGKHLVNLSLGKDMIYRGKKYKAKDLTYLEKGKKVSIVLDTLMNSKIWKFVKDSNIFISEADFSSEDADKAKAHLHLTAEQAARIAKKAKTEKLILTHIGGRYEKNPKKLLNEAKNVFENSLLANDFDVINI